MVKFVVNSNKDTKDTNKTSEGKNVISKKNNPPNINTMSEIQASESDGIIDSDDNKNDSIGLKNFPDMTITYEDSNSSDTDGTERLDIGFYEENHTISNLEKAKLNYQILQSKFSRLNL